MDVREEEEEDNCHLIWCFLCQKIEYEKDAKRRNRYKKEDERMVRVIKQKMHLYVDVWLASDDERKPQVYAEFEDFVEHIRDTKFRTEIRNAHDTPCIPAEGILRLGKFEKWALSDPLGAVPKLEELLGRWRGMEGEDFSVKTKFEELAQLVVQLAKTGLTGVTAVSRPFAKMKQLIVEQIKAAAAQSTSCDNLSEYSVLVEALDLQKEPGMEQLCKDMDTAMIVRDSMESCAKDLICNRRAILNKCLSYLDSERKQVSDATFQQLRAFLLKENKCLNLESSANRLKQDWETMAELDRSSKLAELEQKAIQLERCDLLARLKSSVNEQESGNLKNELMQLVMDKKKVKQMSREQVQALKFQVDAVDPEGKDMELQAFINNICNSKKM
ncbi:hypothetical protein Ciccas_007266 [Cichlidogyrus casuarinus]|uniref:Uncharacterized protein n=1 Tax=Cichlidogyrus casuarinus TaxID=1844966 RepID=A0ABD2Q7C5_9PLAT